MDSKKLRSVMSLSGPERYRYFVRKVADFEEVWGLAQDGWATAADSKGMQALPFWPESEFALACAESAWSGFAPRRVSVSEFLDVWLSRLKQDDLLVAVFPTTGDKGVFVDPAQVETDLRAELAQYE